MHLQDRLITHLKDVFRKTSTIYHAKVSSRCLSDLHLRHLLDICKMSLQDVLLVLVRHLVDVFLPTGK